MGAVGLLAKPSPADFYNKAASYVSYTANSNKSSSSVTLTYLTGITKNSTLIVFGSLYTGTPSMASPWSVVAYSNNIRSGLGSTYIYKRQATGTETGTFSAPFSIAQIINLKYYTVYSAGGPPSNTTNSINLTVMSGDLSLFLYGCRTRCLFTPNLGTEIIDYRPASTHLFSLGATTVAQAQGGFVYPSRDIATMTKTYMYHTAEQMTKVAADGAAFKLGILSRFNALRNHVESLSTRNAVSAVDWNTQL